MSAEQKLPQQVWAIRNNMGTLVPPVDDDGTDGFMAWPTKEQAEKGLEHQRKYNYLDDEENEGEVVQIM